MAKRDNRPNVIDLFSGVGGLSLGAERAGFRVAASAELDPIASKSHADNFPSTTHIECDVARLSGQDLLAASGCPKGTLAGIIGGPPCQGFSLIGRRDQTDPRNDLFGHFFRLVSETLPAFYLAENVPGILSSCNGAFIERAMSVLPSHYVRLEPIKVAANLYGAPTSRTRVFFVGYDPDRLGVIREADFVPHKGLVQTLVRDALFGLTDVKSHWQTEPESWRAVRRLPATEYGKRVFDMVPNGVGNPEAIARLMKQSIASGFLGTKHNADTIKRFSLLEPGEIDRVYRSPRLKFDGLCPTLRAGTNRDKGSYQAVRPIHPRFPRVISPREAARLQGFPDWFVFNPTKWHSFRQIGNSVSPIVGEAILKVISDRI